MPWHLMPWLLASSSHRQLWHWIREIIRSRSFSGKRFKYSHMTSQCGDMTEINAIYFMLPEMNSARSGFEFLGYKIEKLPFLVLPGFIVKWYTPYSDSHWSDVIMTAMASHITSASIVYSSVCSGADQRKHQSSASLAFVRGIHRSPVNSPHKGPVTRKMFPFDDVIMFLLPGCTANNECLTNNGGCQQYCVDTYDSYFCGCLRGYQILNTPYTCGRMYHKGFL